MTFHICAWEFMNRAKDTYIIISYRTISLSHVSSLSHCCTHSQTEAFYQSYESSLTSLVTCVLCGFAHTMQLCPYPKEFSFVPVPWTFALYSHDPHSWPHLAHLTLLQVTLIEQLGIGDNIGSYGKVVVNVVRAIGNSSKCDQNSLNA